ncbi:MAG: RagB/SusD family nutrient uptake outer membrane protein [Sphingobacteriales bacterium 17-39-43]|uniref:RagB/SusD family nutrient uptake outer membrane protein n=1 Tax=Daejeonella sp. TaxID=2805397 RepID=UPI000BDB19B3|nr:RagB/SusD family nutrient uptake outer membrane protein [Daejeonella sp.]OYZ33019.1 MAG: RagB/SusD family nutrient uptake outer membrane protein [Sphingobacteriales bacterium 16-39-50]OZA26429.1 MAG: RagB/SusD family nutrient uptake outer membrane protein [Sphingobacteriales bacterium 17-39-43]HQT21565.1 RagB/SusD family nutrient uptake outer membrane protein [Daejeonella sp.]HQT56296.1 RagB/SusD family nutrient uptake outer membrane protein [Daejeonella sp.]
MKIKHYILATLFLMSLGSCKKYLATEPTDFLNPDNYYETEAQLQFARAGVYDHLGAGGLHGTYASYLLAWTADEGYMNRATLTTGPWNYFYSSADNYNAGLWNNLWSGINKANVLIKNVDKNTAIAQEKRDAIRGESLFLRAYFYFTLVQYYGGVPLKLEPTTSVVDVDDARASAKDVYLQIIKDMEAAEKLVPSIKTLGFGGAISKSAVRGLLARVNLHMAGEPVKDKTRYAEASKWAKMVIDDAEAGHSLNPSYPDIFMKLAGDKYDIKESIWEVEFYGNLKDQYVETGNIGWINGPASNVNSATGRADAYMNITSELYDKFEPGDNRKWFSIAHFTYTISSTNGSKTLALLPVNDHAKNLMKPAKWRREYETLLPKAPTRTPQNMVLLRYSDVLLMYAEAENELKGPTADAVEAFNKVRRRAWSTGIKTIAVTNGGSGYTTAPTVTFSGNGGATAKATVSGGRVTEIILDRDAMGITFFNEGKYTAVPTITISGGGGSGATAIATINKATDGNLNPASKEAFLAAIQDERMREFNFENLRKADLLRWGIFLKVHQDMGNKLQQQSPGQFFVKNYSNVSSRDLLMPIPINEMSSNLKMTQNPGWE